MTRDSLIKELTSNPAVRLAHSTRKTDGSIQDPPAAELEARCATALQFALFDAATNNAVARLMGNRRNTLTLTSGVATLEDDMGQVEAVQRGSDGSMIEGFANVRSYLKWMDRNGYSSDVANSANAASRYHLFDRNEKGKRKLTLVPGTGDETTLTVWYLKKAGSPPKLEDFDEEVHFVIYAVAINYLTGFQYTQMIEAMIGRIAQRDELTIGEPATAELDDDLYEGAAIRNASYLDTQ